MSQFFYVRKEPKPSAEGQLPEFKEVVDSFNVEFVIRTMQLDDDRRLVLLNDMHERSMDVPDIDPKTNKMRGMKRERNVYQSEIYLEPKDAERFVRGQSTMIPYEVVPNSSLSSGL